MDELISESSVFSISNDKIVSYLMIEPLLDLVVEYGYVKDKGWICKYNTIQLTLSTPAHILAACAPQAINTTPFPPGTFSPTAEAIDGPGDNLDVTTFSTAAVNVSHPLFA